jgi:alkylation response protein AidB-like acyl-CoA dehydrogenase
MTATLLAPTRFVALAGELADVFAERADRIDRDNIFPHENFDDLRASGYLKLTVPERYGGLGADPIAYVLAQERLAQGCASTALAVNMHLSLMGRLGADGPWPEERYAELAHAVSAGKAIINATNSEPELGSPSRGALPSTTATRTADGWVVNGRKRWATLAPALTHMYSLVTVIDGAAPPRRGNILIPANAPGVRIEETWNNLGMRGTGSHDIVYENVLVDADALLPNERAGAPNEGAAWWTFPSSAVYLGVGIAAKNAAIAYAKDRSPNGMTGTIAELQTVQHRIAEMEILIWQAHTLLLDTAREWQATPEPRGDLVWKLGALNYTLPNNVLKVTEIALRVAG